MKEVSIVELREKIGKLKVTTKKEDLIINDKFNEMNNEVNSAKWIELNTLITYSLANLEIKIRRCELYLKIFRIQLKNSQEYEKFKTLKAKEEHCQLETFDVADELLLLKQIRNQWRSLSEEVRLVLSFAEYTKVGEK